MLSDLRYALRSFRKSPAFTAVAVLSIALGIGANTAIFSLLDRVLLRMLPVNSPASLVLLTANGPRRGSVETNYDDTYTFSYPMYTDFRDRAPALAGVLAWMPVQSSLSLNGANELVPANLVSGNYFDVLGVRTVIGRPIGPNDATTPGANPVVVLSHSFWTQRFSTDPAILNRTVLLNGQPMIVIGVAAPGFRGLAVGEDVAAFVPLTMVAQMLPGRSGFDLGQRRAYWLNVMARLKSGTSSSAAESALNAFWRPILSEEVKAMPRATPAFRQAFGSRRLTLLPAGNGISNLRTFFGTPLVLLMALVGLVLLIACGNVANLLIARATARQKEIAIRMAIGASRGSIVRQVLTESLTLAAAGGLLGLFLASWSGNLLLRLLPMDGNAGTISAAPDLRILGFTALVALLCGVLFGLLPALQSMRTDLASTMKAQTGAMAGRNIQSFTRKALVVGQVALSLLLLIGAGLFLRGLRNLKDIDPGFRTDHLISFNVSPRLNGYDETRAGALLERITARLRGVPGVRAAFVSNTPLLANMNWDRSVVVPGYEPKENDSAPNVDSIGPGYFAGLGWHLLAGREFTEADSANAPKVAVVNQFFAQYYYGRPDVLGRVFYFGGDDRKTPVEIVGIAQDGKYADLREPKQRFVYCPYPQQFSPGPATFYIRTQMDPATLAPSLRAAVREADPNLPLFQLKTMEQQIDELVFAERIVSALSAVFGLLATLLAAIGLYGVMSYSVARRTREIGIRMALGATRASVLSMVLSEIGILAALGVVIAIAASFPLTKLARSLMYNVAPHDPLVLTAAALLLLLTTIAAVWHPASRATKVDPLTALRIE